MDNTQARADPFDTKVENVQVRQNVKVSLNLMFTFFQTGTDYFLLFLHSYVMYWTSEHDDLMSENPYKAEKRNVEQNSQPFENLTQDYLSCG